MTVQIHGKSYKTVVERVNDFRSDSRFQGWAITTKILKMEGGDCIIRASIISRSGNVKATGLAHEVQGSTNINKTSHVENCETSAIGRALAAFGLGGTEYASGDEVGTAVINQAVKEALEKSKKLLDAVMQHHSSVMAIKEGIVTGDLSSAAEEWFALTDDTKTALWLSPTAGGCFTTKERDVIKSSEFRLSYFGEENAS